MSLVVGFKQKLPFKRIAGRDYCLWQYDVTREPVDDIAQLALGFSGLLDIQDPADFPEVAALTGTRLEKSLTGGNQFIFVIPPAEHPATLSVHFVAPCAEDSFTPIVVVTIDSNGERRSPVFRTSPESLDNTAQIVLGPSAASPNAASPTPAQGPAVVKTGTLPYASELFGVYQPLLGWRSALAQSRLSDATANRFATATRLIVSDAPLTVEKPIGTLQSRGALNRTGTNIGQQLATHVSDLHASPAAATEWHSLLTAAHGSVLSTITRNVMSGLQKDATAVSGAQTVRARTTQATAVSPSPPQVAHEAATATLLHYLGQNAPGVLSQIFHPIPAAWQRALAGAIWFSDNHPAKAAFLSPIGILHRFRE